MKTQTHQIVQYRIILKLYIADRQNQQVIGFYAFRLSEVIKVTNADSIGKFRMPIYEIPTYLRGTFNWLLNWEFLDAFREINVK